MNAHFGTDSEFDSEDEELERGFDQLQATNVDEDRESESTKPLSTGLARTYIPRWHGAHAFREFYQNWADAIKQTNNLGGTLFRTKLEDTSTVWLFKALHPSTEKLLGFIRFMKRSGTVELTNFGAHLSRKTVDLGYTSKHKNADLAGCHGEGYKMASLVLVREGYRVKIATSNRHWSFRFGGRDKRHLWCYFSKTNEKSQGRLKKQQDAYAAKCALRVPRDAKANIWQDVSIVIGGGGSKVRTVSQSDFLEWIQQCIDLDTPSSMINTELGDLILDPKFANKMYLKGLLLEGGRGPRSKQWKFGYNLAQGEVNRDRQQLTDPEKQGEIITRIWNDACQKNKAATLLPYLGMLRAETQCLDISYAENYMSEVMATAIWEQLLREAQRHNLFYYHAEHADHDVELIRKSLKKKPKSLQRVIWNPLRTFNLVRTAEEQRHHLLHNASQSALPSIPYSGGFNRTLKAVLSLDPRTKDLELSFRSGKEAELDLLLDGSALLVNDRWLDFHTSHEGSFCSLFTEALYNDLAIDSFSCGHVVTDLYELLLVELSKTSDPKISENGEPNTASLRQRVCESIQQMPCKVAVVTGSQAQELVVSWMHLESEKAYKLHDLDLKGRVTLHRMSICAAKASELLTSGNFTELPGVGDVLPSADQSAVNVHCGCPEKVISLKDSCTIFRELDHTQKYFPMVSRTAPQSFFGLPPSAAAPKEPQIMRLTLTPAPAQIQPAASPQLTMNERSRDGNEVGNDYGFFGYFHSDEDDDDDDDDGMEIDTFIRSAADQITSSGHQIVSRPRESRSSLLSTSPNTMVVSERRSHIKKLRKETEDQQKQLNDQGSRLENYGEEVDDLRSKLALHVEMLQTAESETQNLQRDLLVAREEKSDAIIKLKEATAGIPHWTKQLENAAVQSGALEKDVRVKKEVLQAAESSTETLKQNIQDADRKIEQLQARICLLKDTNHGLENDLDTARDIIANQAQLAQNGAARMITERQIKEEDGGASPSSTKRPRLLDVISRPAKNPIILD